MLSPLVSATSSTNSQQQQHVLDGSSQYFLQRFLNLASTLDWNICHLVRELCEPSPASPSDGIAIVTSARPVARYCWLEAEERKLSAQPRGVVFVDLRGLAQDES